MSSRFKNALLFCGTFAVTTCLAVTSNEEGFSEWTAWSCDVSCGSGIGFRLRYCFDFTKPCVGRTRQTRPGCAKFPCPSHDKLPKKLWATTREVLADSHFNIEVEASQSVTLRCNNKAARNFDRYYPQSTTHWVKNERALMINPSRTVYDRGDLLITSVRSTDTGLYQCKIEWEKGKRQTIALYAISVNSTKVNIHTKISKTLHIRCNNRPINQIYGKLNAEWYHENEVYHLNSTVKVDQDYSLKLKDIKKSHEGVWKCVVYRRKSGLHWTTNRVKIFVSPEPSIFEKLITNTIFVWIATISLVFVLCLGVNISSYIARKQLKNEANFNENDKLTHELRTYFNLPDLPASSTQSAHGSLTKTNSTSNSKKMSSFLEQLNSATDILKPSSEETLEPNDMHHSYVENSLSQIDENPHLGYDGQEIPYEMDAETPTKTEEPYNTQVNEETDQTTTQDEEYDETAPLMKYD